MLTSDATTAPPTTKDEPLPTLGAAAQTGARSLSIRLRLVLFSLALMLPAVLTGALIVQNGFVRERAAVERHLQDTARAIALAVDRQLGQADATLRALSTSHHLQHGDLAQFHARSVDILAESGVWIALWDAQGRQLLNGALPFGATLPDAPDPQVLAALRTGQGAVSDVLNGPIAANIVSVHVPIMTEGKPDGVLSLMIPPANFTEILREQDLPDGWVGTIHDRRGTVVARSVGSEQFEGAGAQPDLLESLRVRDEAVLESTSLDGWPSVMAYSRSPRFGWTFAVSLPQAQLHRAVRQSQAWVLGGGALILAAAGLIAARLGRRIAGPVEDLAGAAARLGRGEPVRPPRTGMAEIDRVAAALAEAGEARARVEQGLRASEARFRALFEQAAVGLELITPDGVVRDVNPRLCAMLGYLRDEMVDRNAEAFVHPEDQRTERPLLRQLASGAERSFVIEKRLLARDGRFVWTRCTTSLLESDSARAWRIAVVEDITDRRAAEDRQRLLTREVDHRAKNLLAVVQSVLRLTRAATLEDYRNAIEGRVEALSRAHTLLADSRWEGAEVGRIVAEELAPFADRTTAAGPTVQIAATAAQSLAMAVHELATNAAKYGALSDNRGHVAVGWRITGDGALVLTWTERNGPPAPPPQRPGTGLLVVEASITHQLRGRVDMDWSAAGLGCALLIPRETWCPGGEEPPAALRDAPGAAAAPTAAATPATALRSILVVEDSALVALELKGTLEGRGYRVLGPAGSVEQALRIIAATPPDAAVLDVNLDGTLVFPVADALAARGVPFVFCTGYDAKVIEETAHAHVRVVRKPVDPRALRRELDRLLG